MFTITFASLEELLRPNFDKGKMLNTRFKAEEPQKPFTIAFLNQKELTHKIRFKSEAQINQKCLKK